MFDSLSNNLSFADTTCLSEAAQPIGMTTMDVYLFPHHVGHKQLQ